VTYTGADVPDDAVHVEANAYQWNWNMNYPDQGIESLTASDVDLAQAEGLSGPVIVVPKGEPVYFTLTSEDVIHAFAVSDLGLKQDAVPGQSNTIKTTPLETGVYQGHCTEFCGAGHSQMNFNVIVVEQDTYQQFLDAQGGGSSNSSSVSN
jgi:cytochrome c oxidase subunit 2